MASPQLAGGRHGQTAAVEFQQSDYVAICVFEMALRKKGTLLSNSSNHLLTRHGPLAACALCFPPGTKYRSYQTLASLQRWLIHLKFGTACLVWVSSESSTVPPSLPGRFCIQTFAAETCQSKVVRRECITTIS